MVTLDDKEWFVKLSDRERDVVVEFVNRCKKNNFAIFDVFKVREWTRKAAVRELELVTELEQRNKDLSALCAICPMKSGTAATVNRIHELELKCSELREENRGLREK